MSTNTNARYHSLQVSLHWLVVLLIFATFLLGKYMSGIPIESEKVPLLGIHMVLGFIALVAIIVRFITRLRLPLPTSVKTGNAFLDVVSKGVHEALFVIVFLMTLSGVSLSLQSGLLPAVFGASSAALTADFFEFRARVLHGFIAPALLVLVLVHVRAAFYHQFALKDNLLSRMWYDRPLKESK
jgi:cytochrome b561